MMTKTQKPASDKQIALIHKLAGEKDYNFGEDTAADMAAVLRGESIEMKYASGLIDLLFAAPKKADPNKPKAQPGYYLLDDVLGADVYVVVENKAKTSTYAKRLVISQTADGKKKGKWEYAPGVGGNLAKDGLQPLSLEQAINLSHKHGVCVICGKSLINPKSVEKGIGPVCRAKLGY